MRNQLMLTALIVLLAFALSSPPAIFSAMTHCSDCGAEAHHNPADCVRYAHASDCPCASCADSDEDTPSFIEDVLVPASNELPFTDAMRGFMDYCSHHWDGFWSGVSEIVSRSSSTPDPRTPFQRVNHQY